MISCSRIPLVMEIVFYLQLGDGLKVKKYVYFLRWKRLKRKRTVLTNQVQIWLVTGFLGGGGISKSNNMIVV